jgi:hypothetical protein
MEKGKRRKLLARQWWYDETETGTETDNCRFQTTDSRLQTGNWGLQAGLSF